MLDDLFKRTEHLVQQSVECMLKQMLKLFKRAFTLLQPSDIVCSALYSALPQKVTRQPFNNST